MSALLAVRPLGRLGSRLAEVVGQQGVDELGPVHADRLGGLLGGRPAVIRDADAAVLGLGLVGHVLRVAGVRTESLSEPLWCTYTLRYGVRTPTRTEQPR